MSRQVFKPKNKRPEPYGIEDAIKSPYQVISVKHKPNYIQCCYQQEMYIYVRRWFSWYNSNLGPQMVHNPNGPVMVHFYVLSTNYTKKPAHSILKRRNKVNLIQMVHKWYTFTSIPLIILKKQVTAYYNTEIKWTSSNGSQMVHN